jgi:HAD superfamily hydrolase (TIGR01549 family)
MPTVDWSAIRLVVFDVDGTLYSQRAIRSRMLTKLILSSLRHASIRPLRVIGFYRKCREELSDAEVEDFENILLARTASACDVKVDEARRIAEEWLEQRPLPLLRDARYPHVDRVFAALRERGILIGVLSDYPAADKLAALDLEADFVFWAGESDVNVLKPHPRGLKLMMDRAGVIADQALMVGDRNDRDGEIARRSGVRPLIRSTRPLAGCSWFRSYDAEPFSALLT